MNWHNMSEKPPLNIDLIVAFEGNIPYLAGKTYNSGGEIYLTNHGYLKHFGRKPTGWAEVDKGEGRIEELRTRWITADYMNHLDGWSYSRSGSVDSWTKGLLKVEMSHNKMFWLYILDGDGRPTAYSASYLHRGLIEDLDKSMTTFLKWARVIHEYKPS